MNKSEILLQTQFARNALRVLEEVIGEYDQVLEEDQEIDQAARENRLILKNARIYLSGADRAVRQAEEIFDKLST